MNVAGNPLLRLRAVRSGYRRQPVIDGIDLDIGEGEILCLLGPNGSGKTTLFRTLLGLLPPLAGDIELLGTPLSQWTRAALAREVGYVPQAHDGMFAFSVEDIVVMGRAARVGLFAAPSQHDHAIASHCLDTLGIAHLATRSCTDISGGERQLMLIARALAQEPKLLVMDEPTASLDFGNQLRVLEHIVRLRDAGMAILMSTHQPEHALRCADRIALLAQGRIVASGPAATTATVAQLANLYGVEETAVARSLTGTLSAQG